MKTQDVPPPLRAFNAQFSKFGYRWDATQIFDDFLTLTICAFAWQTEEELYFETIKKYSKEDLNIFCAMLGEWIIFQNQYCNGDWSDMLGTFYEILRSNYKAQKLGQFFTPQPVCDVMANLIIGDFSEKGEMVNDPTCGSGRLFLAANKIKPNHFYFVGADLDKMCVKMSALNLMVHGCRGEVHHMDSLKYEKYDTFYVNGHNDKFGLFSILRRKKKPPQEIEPPPTEIEQEPPPQQEFTFKLEF